jgi:hypothetical protein
MSDPGTPENRYNPSCEHQQQDKLRTLTHPNSSAGSLPERERLFLQTTDQHQLQLQLQLVCCIALWPGPGARICKHVHAHRLAMLTHV